jgi:hypothetical protein
MADKKMEYVKYVPNIEAHLSFAYDASYLC